MNAHSQRARKIMLTKKKKKNANALTTRVDFSGEKGCEMIPVAKHQAFNEIYICATSALTDDRTLVTKKKKKNSMPAGG